MLNRFFVKLKLIFFSFVNVAHTHNGVAYVFERTGRTIHFKVFRIWLSVTAKLSFIAIRLI